MTKYRCASCGETFDDIQEHNKEKRRVENIIVAAILQDWCAGDIKGLSDENVLKQLNARDYEEIVEIYEAYLKEVEEPDVELIVRNYIHTQRIGCMLKKK